MPESWETKEGSRRHWRQACPLLERSLILERELGDKIGTVGTLRYLGLAALGQKDYAQAQILFEECLSVARQLEHTGAIAFLLSTLGRIAFDAGDYTWARARFVESLTAARELDHLGPFLPNLAGFAGLCSVRGEPMRATRLWGAAEALCEAISSPLLPSDQEKHDQQVAAAREILGEAAFTEAWEIGRAMTLDQAVEYALGA